MALLPSRREQMSHVRVMLSDTGRGMSQDEQKQLFTKIVQFSPNDAQKGGGSGIMARAKFWDQRVETGNPSDREMAQEFPTLSQEHFKR